MRLTFRIELRAVDAAGGESVYEEKLVMATVHGEVLWHIALKALGYLLFFEHRLQVEKGVGWRYKPDLVSVDDRGRVRLWVDCGNIGPRKIVTVAHKVAKEGGRFVILKRHRHEARMLARQLAKRTSEGQVSYLAFDDHFVERLTELLDANNTLTVDRRTDEQGVGSLRIELVNRRGVTVLESTVRDVGP